MCANKDLPAGQPELRQPTLPELNARVLVAGDVMLDRYWFGDVHRISPEAPVPVVSIARCEDRLGGAANVARNVVALGAKASLVGLVGDDEAAHCVRQLMNQAHIDGHLFASSLLSTIVKLRVLGRHQQLLRVDFDGESVAADFSGWITAYLRRLLEEHQVIVLSDYGKGSLADVSSMISLARSCGKAILIDPKGDDFQRYAHATMLTPNKAELRQIIGGWRSDDELAQKSQSLRKMLSVEYLLLTRAEEGMTLFDERGAQHFPAQAREIFDVCGAGDTVIATLATWLASGSSLTDAIVAANRAAGLVVAKLGTATVVREEIFPATAC